MDKNEDTADIYVEAPKANGRIAAYYHKEHVAVINPYRRKINEKQLLTFIVAVIGFAVFISSVKRKSKARKI